MMRSRPPRLLSTIIPLDPDLGEPVRHSIIESKQIFDPVSPLLSVRRSFASSLPSSVVVPRYQTLPPRKSREGKNLQGIRNVVAVCSGKGGVGKSTLAVNLAATFHSLGARTGLFDADIHGPSLPTMMVSEKGGEWKVVRKQDKTLDPVVLHSIKCMSYGFVSPGTGGKGTRSSWTQVSPGSKGPQAAIMRGPIASKTADELLCHTNWGDLDVLVLDLPPGTGDVHLSMFQRLSVDAAVVVTTPQELSFVDVARGIDMLEALKVPVVAIVENMSWFVCNHGERHYPFGIRGEQNLRRLKTAYGVDLTVSLPIVPAFSDAGDSGVPFVNSVGGTTGVVTPNEKAALEAYETLVRGVSTEMVRHAEFGDTRRPQVSFNENDNTIVLRLFEGDSAKQYKIPAYKIREKLRMIDEMLGLKLNDLAKDVKPKSIQPKGNYAVSITWSDGYAMSVYPYDDLIRVAKELEDSTS